MVNKSVNNTAIGVFDSGLGGLTVVRELMRQLPDEHIVYFGDTARVPYGTKSKSAIVRFSHENARLLLKHKVKLIVVACNSSASVALRSLQKTCSVPVIGVIAPGARRAVHATRNNKVGVIATAATIASGAYTQHIKRYNARVRVTGQACGLFVPLVEEGWTKKKAAYGIARDYLSFLKRAGVDTVILGCTHYPLLKNVIGKVLGKKIALIDSAQEVAREVKDMLACNNMFRKTKGKARYTFLVSDEPKHFSNMAKKFFGINLKKIGSVSHV